MGCGPFEPIIIIRGSKPGSGRPSGPMPSMPGGLLMLAGCPRPLLLLLPSPDCGGAVGWPSVDVDGVAPLLSLTTGSGGSGCFTVVSGSVAALLLVLSGWGVLTPLCVGSLLPAEGGKRVV